MKQIHMYIDVWWKKPECCMWYSPIYSVLLLMCLREKATINSLWGPMYVSAQGGKGPKKELELEQVIKKDSSFICL